jgi:L-amino acid N-acyltransferase YncA
MNLLIRRAELSDFDQIWAIIHNIFVEERTYPFSPETTKDEILQAWMNDHVHCYVCISEGRIVGSYILKPNWTGGGSHVANASYVVEQDCRGKGVGKTMGRHSIEEAKKFGFMAMQFNFVVSTNATSVNLWKELGFQIVGTLPGAFKHPDFGFVDAYVMFRSLEH